MSLETLLIKRHEVASLLSLDECIAAVERTFKLRALGEVQAPAILGVHAAKGGFHTKAGILNLGTPYFVAKTNANFPGNLKAHGLPTIQGVVVVCNAENGRLLALMDSIEMTIIRTGAATGVAAKYLSRKDSKTASIIGCGNQGKISLKALLKVRDVKIVYAYDIDASIAERFAEQLSNEVGVAIDVVDDIGRAVRQSDICITCTPSKKYFLHQEDVRPGTFIAAVGSDNEDKQELDPQLLSQNILIVDSAEQCAKIGELHHALESGLVPRNRKHIELGEVIAGIKPGRTSESEIVIFDSTGTALQDVASAAIVYEKAIQRGIGSKINFAE